MAESNGKPAKSLMGLNVNIGQLTAALGPLGFVVWQGIAWATEIESNIKANQAQIEQLVEVVRSQDDEERERDERLEDLLRIMREVRDEADDDEAEPTE